MVIENDGMYIDNIQSLCEEKNNIDMDESTFIIWKTELQKELSSFWELMNKY